MSTNRVLQSQKAVSANLKSEHILPFGFARQNKCYVEAQMWRSAQRVALREIYVDALVSTLTRRGSLVTMRREKLGYFSEKPTQDQRGSNPECMHGWRGSQAFPQSTTTLLWKLWCPLELVRWFKVPACLESRRSRFQVSKKQNVSSPLTHNDSILWGTAVTER